MKIGAKPDDDFYLITMRVSVILTDFLFFYACGKITKALNDTWKFHLALYVNMGLILIDNVHF